MSRIRSRFRNLSLTFFLQQTEKYAGASDHTLQQLRYLREGIFLNAWTPEAAGRYALQLRCEQATTTEDLAAFQHFAQDLRLEVPR